MELSQSLRLFGGLAVLQERIHEEAPQLGVQALAWSSNSLAALALSRSAQSGRRLGTGRHGGIHFGGGGLSPGANGQAGTEGWQAPLSEQLDPLPLHTLRAAHPHLPILARLGCSTLGHLRALPRGGLRRRFDRELLQALDRAYGLQPETHAWHTLPDTFATRLDLMARVAQAPALLFGARRLLLALCAWLSARHEGVTACRLRWTHDAPRHHDTGPGELVLRTAQPTRDLEHLSRLLAEHLSHLRLRAPVDTLELASLETQPLPDSCASLLPGGVPAREGESLGLVMERIAARLGAQRVLRPQPQADHRLEWMTHWQAATGGSSARPRAADPGRGLPQPCFVLPQPLRLPMQGAHPVYHGALRFLTGPHRVEAGWWDRTSDEAADTSVPAREEALAYLSPAPAWPARSNGATDSDTVAQGPSPRPVVPGTRHVARDYWVALSEQAGVLWVFQERQPEADAWYLHGIFA